jgi:hypothetical protein
MLDSPILALLPESPQTAPHYEAPETSGILSLNRKTPGVHGRVFFQRRLK